MSKEMSLMDMEQKLIEKTDNLVYELKQLNVVYQNLAKDVADMERMIEKRGSRIDSLYSLAVALVVLKITNIILTVVFEIRP
jgi:t-SNARE complex subunit (syntaxin)